jgi:glycine cleavage system regulatory protein
MSETGTKKMTQSKTFWGVALAWVTQFLNTQGINIEELTSGSVTTTALISVFCVIALWGRYKASSKIDKLV